MLTMSIAPRTMSIIYGVMTIRITGGRSGFGVRDSLNQQHCPCIHGRERNGLMNEKHWYQDGWTVLIVLAIAGFLYLSLSRQEPIEVYPLLAGRVEQPILGSPVSS